ncbi:hypothetical protein BCR33DRAFT_713045 [Rhizoclosmatium globosum]|uniref:DUF829-domain-containing protein n=1 Tax=Rhizoclosmatium globosum TaxID=329046 RepID=A0A1Y2CV57_9FUNG|nr:hypothetical protein BCR33DRAFT_713045 [Rhizoclosmatium globosum]|eukprot:ORY50205.1 hypothetical protein BCR33DRAFT_713045 [Rhizoclosmatium globosum]
MTPNPSPTKFVFVFGWANGQLRNVQKYTEFYSETGFVPLVVLSNSDDVKRTRSMTQPLDAFDDLIPVLEKCGVVAKTGAHSQAVLTNPTIAVHVLSNGGVMKLRHFLNALHSRNLVIKPKCAVVLDSCPGLPDIGNLSTFAVMGVKNPYLNRIAKFLVSIALRFQSLFVDIAQHPIATSAPYAVSERNTDGNLIGPRLFLYSDTDELVRWQDTQNWIESAKAEGLDVDQVFFKNSHM